MPIRPVLTWPDERLRAIAEDVSTVDDEVRQLIVDLFETMYEEDGVGLAATQVGVPQRVVVIDCEQGDGGSHRARQWPHYRERELSFGERAVFRCLE